MHYIRNYAINRNYGFTLCLHSNSYNRKNDFGLRINKAAINGVKHQKSNSKIQDGLQFLC